MAVHTRLSFYYWMDCTGKKLALVCVINRDCPELSCTKKIFQSRLFHEIDLICNPRCQIVNYVQGNTTHIAQGFLGNIAKLILLKIDILVEAQQRRGSSPWCSISTIKLCVQSLSFYPQHQITLLDHQQFRKLTTRGACFCGKLYEGVCELYRKNVVTQVILSQRNLFSLVTNLYILSLLCVI